MLVITGTCCELLTCISVVLSVVGGVKGTFKLRLSLEGPPPIPKVYQHRRSFFFLGGGEGGLNTFKRLRMSLERPPPILNVYQRRCFIWVGVG